MKLRCWSAGVVRTSKDAAPKRLLPGMEWRRRTGLAAMLQPAQWPVAEERVLLAGSRCRREHQGDELRQLRSDDLEPELFRYRHCRLRVVFL
ncbi:MAG: hypothetical protein M3N47_10105, partial [Chloroflexota bacterium]|nr:hypothetical protein [Chloroflexota bacterium]